ncbi:hypothetical protein ACN08Y_01170 [Rothia sp. P5764]|uniref:hypothetical protein n=1 Tax=unclassified Rothia (in: high G+C Gram-positive bacteria) TaxID=2689056 RepID=UPI003AD16206
MSLILADGANPLAPTTGELVITIVGLVYLVAVLTLFVFSIVVLLTWVRKNKLRVIELEFEEQAIDRRRAQGGQEAE